jgi:ribonucleoside-triphosphate reductase
MSSSRKDVAKEYIQYRYKRGLVREINTTDKSILELLNGTNDYWNNENSNKDSKIVTVQRDYLAGITSTDITKRFLLPPDVLKAHEEGILHFHDADYFAQKALNNCGLINLEDMLQNGTVINGVMIETPHRLLTAMTIATQIITAVASSQYGGCTITLTHLAPFVKSSYNYYLTKHYKQN